MPVMNQVTDTLETRDFTCNVEPQDWQTLPVDLDPQCLPQHIAVIMDGNGRWAKQRGLPRLVGHRQGVKALKALVRCCQDWRIPALTVYAFSTENWQRPPEEVEFLMQLFEQMLWQELDSMHREGVRLAFIGDLAALPHSLRSLITDAMSKTAHNGGVHLQVALNYGSRHEIVQTCRTLGNLVAQGKLSPEEITENLFTQFLDTAGQGDPDLLIRTSGEMRLSNFLLWQLAYTEIYCTPVFWPDFSRQDLYQALQSYQRRDRRFGRV